MGDDIHAERREPAPPAGATDLAALGDEVLAQARELQTGRSARTLTPGSGGRLKQTLMALEVAAGQWALIPDETHDLRALSDATVLLTVASGTG